MKSAPTDSNVTATSTAVYQAFGAMACECQLFEYTLSNILALVFGPGPDVTVREVRVQVELNFAKTTGRLKAELAQILGGQAPLVEQVANAVERRNFLVHHYFRDRIRAMQTPKGRALMVDELARDRRLFLRTKRELLKEYGKWLTAHGLPPDSNAAAWPVSLKRRRVKRAQTPIRKKGVAAVNPADRADGNRKQRGSRRSSA